ncbi:MAG TPA: ribonuclease PH [Syntrophales bacterium]|nr:ribonuclease PH [Syntrophales bacterium]HOL59077.1 ribonuclease PH [Syntrophales bacterium]HPO35414.1 ribonuclease PH [Syntrophales bacterium]
MSLQRQNDRRADEIRPVQVTRNYLKYAPGSVLIEMGETKVICAASFSDEVPPFLRETGQGWLTAEYAMLPMATMTRNPRGRVTGRTYEIQRIVGRSLRAVVDLGAIGPRTVYVDCDVIQADGGTRTASITGGFIATTLLFENMIRQGLLASMPILDYVAAVSVGIVEGEILLDLDYGEDVRAEVDMNVVMTASGKLVEVQGTAERMPFERKKLEEMLDLAWHGVQGLISVQKRVVGDWK